MSKKQNSYINEELSLLKKWANQIKEDCEQTPYNLIEDRIETLNGPKGPSDKIVATKEVIQKARIAAYREYALLIDAINNLEREEEKKNNVRGGSDLSPLEGGDI